MVVFVALVVPFSRAATLWTGQIVGFTQSGGTPFDTVLAGKVVLTRDARDVLYNTAAGEHAAGVASPLDTLWAFGDLTNYLTLSYQTLEDMRDGDLALLLINHPMVMHIVNEDIYLSVEFLDWGTHGAGGFSYLRSTPAITPSVSLTNPTPNSVYAAPANVKLAATASVSGGTVTNVAFFRNTTLVGSVQNPPFSITASNLPAGPYPVTAVATASGASATSSVVNITVVSPVAVNLTSARKSGGLFLFNYSVNTGLTYVVQRSSNLFSWVPVVTNVAATNPVQFSEGITNPGRFYRVGRLPNPP